MIFLFFITKNILINGDLGKAICDMIKINENAITAETHHED